MAGGAVAKLEAARVAQQEVLDARLPSKERNRLGQFSTPYALATDVLALARGLFPLQEKITFLDPAFGTGVFFGALLEAFGDERVERALGFEVDGEVASAARSLWASAGVEIRSEDFTAASPAPGASGANLVVCNPPYVRHHHLDGSTKARLLELVKRSTGLAPSGLSGFYCYFMLLSHRWMSEGGYGVWLVPSEFMDVNYGEAVKDYLLTKVTLLRVHRFSPSEIQFDDALVSSAIVVLKKMTPPLGHSVQFSYGGTLGAPLASRSVPVPLLRETPKWTNLTRESPSSVVDLNRPKLVELFSIKRGIATGSNEFFALTRERIEKYQIPADFLRPILPSPRYLPVDEIQSDERGDPLIDNPRYLLECNLPEREVEARCPSLWRYLQEGVRLGIDQLYLCRHRSPWYSQEQRPPSRFLFTYMGRQRAADGKAPFRFILNHSRATAANSYLILYPRPPLVNLLDAKPELERVVWEALRSIPPDVLIGGGRVYGGGLYKMEPRELAHAPADTLLEGLPRLLEL